MYNNYFELFFKLYRKYLDDDILAFSSQLAYNFLLASFPFLIFTVALISKIGLKTDLFNNVLKSILPYNSYILIINILSETIYQNHNTLISVTIVIAIWTASIGFSGVVKGINRAYNIRENRPYWKLQIINVVYTILLAMGIVFTMIILMYGGWENKILIKNTGYDVFLFSLWRVTKYVIVGLFLVLIFAAVYRYAPCIRLSWSEVLPGTIFTVITWLLASFIFSYYANNYARYSNLYGSITAVIVLMIWLFVSSNIILIGGEINSALSLKVKKRM
ncbi:MAG: YihY/virulence factor BrkB family protein [Clostridiaceae bacterium]|nr:YihY/virulence factor BrkB family protein [Clostridiaceae bacterium]